VFKVSGSKRKFGLNIELHRGYRHNLQTRLSVDHMDTQVYRINCAPSKTKSRLPIETRRLRTVSWRLASGNTTWT
jgi:hypothetical protein